jgi:hypothetical protein
MAHVVEHLSSNHKALSSKPQYHQKKKKKKEKELNRTKVTLNNHLTKTWAPDKDMFYFWAASALHLIARMKFEILILLLLKINILFVL